MDDVLLKPRAAALWFYNWEISVNDPVKHVLTKQSTKSGTQSFQRITRARRTIGDDDDAKANFSIILKPGFTALSKS